MHETLPGPESPDSRPWYAGISRYQWIVLAIAAAGWAFDQYESQVFTHTKDDVLREVGRVVEEADVNGWTQYLYAIFLIGSATGGLLAGTLADRFGRRPLLVATILFYSLFAGLMYLVTDLWQVCVIRFLVAMGIGGEWAVGASLVAETFPKRVRAITSGMFHSSSVLGIWAATGVGMYVGDHWRQAYLVGLLPALLTFVVLARMKEPKKWQAKAEELEEEAEAKRLGSFKELLGTPKGGKGGPLGGGAGAGG